VERPIRSRDIEDHVMFEGGLEQGFGVAQQIDQLDGMQCRLHAVRSSHEQWIVEVLAKAGEADAHGGLAQLRVSVVCDTLRVRCTSVIIVTSLIDIGYAGRPSWARSATQNYRMTLLTT
jgi:hypothetical protein